MPSVTENEVEPALGLSGEERDAEVHGFFEFGRNFGEHGKAAGDVETADTHRDAGRAQGPREVHSVGELIGLHAD